MSRLDMMKEQVKEWAIKGLSLPSWLLDDYRDVITEYGRYTVPSEEELKTALEYLNIDKDELYLIPISFSPYYFNRGFCYVDIARLDMEYLKLMQVKETIDTRLPYIQECLDNEDYTPIVSMTEKRHLITLLNELYEEIPYDQRRYDVFREIYTYNEYGFQNIEQSILDDVMTLNSNRDFEKLLELDDEGYVTVYRGEGKLSRGLDQAYSWTTDIKVAEFFANRFKGNGTLYKGRVKLENVVDYITSTNINDRSEKEILVEPQNVEDIEIITKEVE